MEPRFEEMIWFGLGENLYLVWIGLVLEVGNNGWSGVYWQVLRKWYGLVMVWFSDHQQVEGHRTPEDEGQERSDEAN